MRCDHVWVTVCRDGVEPLLIRDDKNNIWLLGHDYPFTAPPIDWTMYLLAKIITGNVGSVRTTLASAILPQSTLAYETKFITATGAVTVSLLVMINAKKKSFHAMRKAKTAVAIKPGLAAGITTLTSV